MNLWDSMVAKAREVCKLDSDYEVWFAELLPHPPEEWNRAVVKFGHKVELKGKTFWVDLHQCTLKRHQFDFR